jgi:uncharacterized protein (DUF1684 family)
MMGSAATANLTNLDTAEPTARPIGSGRPGHHPLFVPFSDGTSGHESYGAGRYLDIRAESDGSHVLDINLAYNPYCAYSEAYSCPLPPAENWLPVRIEAGERVPGSRD